MGDGRTWQMSSIRMTIRWCFGKRTLVAVRSSLSGEIGVKEIRQSISQPEKRCCSKVSGKERGWAKYKHEGGRDEPTWGLPGYRW